MTEYITEAGDYGDVELQGDGTGISHENNRDIPLIINAPNQDIIIDNLSISDCWLPLQAREYGSLTIDTLTVSEFMNDGAHFCSNNNLVINKLVVHCEIEKVYSNRNHPDVMQFFPWKKGEPMGNVRIGEIEVFLRNTPEHAGFHLTEDSDYNNFYLGRGGINYDTDSEYPYWLSAVSLRDSIIGHEQMNVSEKGIRIQDVKHTGKPISGVYLLGEQELICAEEHVDTAIMGME